MSVETIGRDRTPARLLSLDASRGVVVATMIFVNNIPTAAYPFLRHAEYNGLTLPDAVFPSFIFIVGVSTAFAFARKQATEGHWVRRLLRRTAVLFGLGVFINFLYAAALRTWRFGVNGVLQRIALSSLLAAPFSRKRPAVVAATGVVLLLAHTALLLWVPVPGGRAGDLEHPRQTMAAYVDRAVLRETGGLDPENLLGTISSAGGMLLGVAVGGVMLRRRERCVPVLLAAGIAALLAGLALSPWLPPNKRLWTATFVLIVTGVDTLLLAAAYVAVEILGRRRLAALAEPLGRNALLLYTGATVLDGLLLAVVLPQGPLYVFLGRSFEKGLGPAGSLLFPAAMVALWYAVAVSLNRRHIHVTL